MTGRQRRQDAAERSAREARAVTPREKTSAAVNRRLREVLAGWEGENGLSHGQAERMAAALEEGVMDVLEERKLVAPYRGPGVEVRDVGWDLPEWLVSRRGKLVGRITHSGWRSPNYAWVAGDRSGHEKSFDDAEPSPEDGDDAR